MTKVPILAAAILLLAWSSVDGQRRDVCPTTVDDTQIVETVFRYQLQQSVEEKKWNLFYLAFGWDPSEQTEACVERWVDAFKEHARPVKKFSKSGFDAEQINKEKGRVLGVAEIKRKTETEAEVEGYIFVVPGEAQGYSYSLIRENGKWIVKASKGSWTARLKGKQKTQEIVATFVAYDRYSGLCVEPLSNPCEEYFVVRADGGEPLALPSYIKIANILKDRRPSKDFSKGGQWRLVLERNNACDGLEEFAYTVVNGKYVFTRPRWGTIAGGERDRLPFSKTTPCYTLKAKNRISRI